jgi:hypothetical protein
MLQIVLFIYLHFLSLFSYRGLLLNELLHAQLHCLLIVHYCFVAVVVVVVVVVQVVLVALVVPLLVVVVVVEVACSLLLRSACRSTITTATREALKNASSKYVGFVGVGSA